MILELDASALVDLEQGIEDLAKQRAEVGRLALNKTLDWLYTRAVRTVADSSGIQQKYVRRMMRKVPASSGGDLIAFVKTRDGFLSLKDFHPHQTKIGVVAMPWNQRRVFPHTFIGPNGHVFKREPVPGDPRRIVKLWGPAIPNEMIRSEKLQALVPYAMAEIFPPQYEFFFNRAVDRTKERFKL